MCIECNDNYILTNTTECSSNSSSESAKTISSATQAISGLSAGAIIGVSIMNLSSLAAIWSIVNQLQLFILLILTKTPFPDNVKTVLLGNEIMQFDLSFIPFTKIPHVHEFEEWASSNQKNIYLDTIGIKSKTSLKNNINFAVIFLVFVALYPLVMTLKL